MARHWVRNPRELKRHGSFGPLGMGQDGCKEDFKVHRAGGKSGLRWKMPETGQDRACLSWAVDVENRRRKRRE